SEPQFAHAAASTRRIVPGLARVRPGVLHSPERCTTFGGAYVCGWSVTSSVVDEFAERLPGHKETDWRVSWLPGRVLTRAQAIAAIELAELLLAPAHPAETDIHATIGAIAEQLGIRPIDAAATLSARHPNG
ncbi:hypothetical protein, partial [Nocardia niigatensis]|uniref:hypothetical protein n=1 Tax=Nocardia niigatensis TaxID=209249 RepID=UPI001C3F2ECB